MTLNIDQESCIKCGKCVRVCPSDIFTQERAGETIGLVRVESCIVCGHCVDVCPTGSVLHSEFPPEKTHTIDYSQMPTPEQVMLLIKSRRSNRTLTSRPVPKEMLDKIVEAAHSAPTATNSQSLSFTVVTDPRKLRQRTCPWRCGGGLGSQCGRRRYDPFLQQRLPHCSETGGNRYGA